MEATSIQNNFYPVTDSLVSVLIASWRSFCTKGIHARSCKIQHWCEWILRLRLKAMRRMTAWMEVSRVHFRIKEELNPVLVKQILLNCPYLSVNRTKTGVKVCVSSLSHHIPSEVSGIAYGSNIYSQNNHPFTDIWESVLIASCMSFSTKGIHARSCRIHHWCEWILRLRLKAMRRMTAWLEMSRVHFGIKGGFRPVLVEQILLNCRYLLVHLTKTGARVCV